FIKEVMEKQIFPERHYTPGGTLNRPYDITSWSLPLHRGVEAYEMGTRDEKLESLLVLIDKQFTLDNTMPADYQEVIFTVNNNESFKTAFQAEQKGLKVYRLKDGIKIEDNSIPAGSFLIKRATSNHNTLNSIIERLNVPPLYIKESLSLEMEKMSVPKIGLVETFFHDMDAGWTRYVFDSYSLPYTVLRPDDFEKIDLRKEFDLIIFPDANESILKEGKRKYENREYLSSYPPEFSQGMGKEGMENLLIFLEKGGHIISWGRSSRLFLGILSFEKGKDEKEEFQLPVRDISEELDKKGLECTLGMYRLFDENIIKQTASSYLGYEE
ncbi:MAG: hypothetical protein P8078_13360, partial [bacterium]